MALAAVSVVAAVVAVAVARGAFSLAVVPLPPPTGAYGVGTVIVRVTHRPSPAPGGDPERDSVARPSALQVWYPATNCCRGRRAPYRFATTTGAPLTRFLGSLMRTESVVGARVAPGRHPVLLYVPAWGGRLCDNTAQAQNLASHGFIVAAMDDLYPYKPMDFSSEPAYRDTLQWANAKVRLQASAVRYTLDFLARLDVADPAGRFAGSMDLERVGIFGFSFGGAVAAEAARQDRRLKAAANLDGWMFGDAAEHGVPRPFLILSDASGVRAVPESASGTVTPEERFTAALDRMDAKQIAAGLARYGGYVVTIEGTHHFNFSDVALMPSLRHTGVGPIGGWRAEGIVAAYLLQFFGHYLRGAPAPLLETVANEAGHAIVKHRLDSAAHVAVWLPRTARPRRSAL